MTPPPPQVNHELTCCHNYEGDEGGKAEQDKDQGRVHRDRKGWRGVGEYQVGKKQEDEKGGGGLCPGCGGEEEFLVQLEDG